MSTRKVKDAKDLSSNELIYFKGHAKATYMSDGSTVEDAINNIEIGTIDPNKLIKITYLELKSLRDNSQLIAGTLYRIINYSCSTRIGKSADHRFDIIVLATSKNLLSEQARAIQNENDPYFNNSNLNSWQLQYTIDNDTSRFSWIDTLNSGCTGVIYYMKDEYSNECPYDFKNIMFYTNDLFFESYCSNDYYYYTFSFITEDNLCLDATVQPNSDFIVSCKNNSIKPYYGSGQLDLNHIIFSMRKYEYVIGNTFLSDCSYMWFLGSNSANHFNFGCYQNKFKKCWDIIFNIRCNQNYLIDCNNVILHNECYDNILVGVNNADLNINHSKLNNSPNPVKITSIEEFYNDGSSLLVPIKHPNLSTQPSILPYKFMGQYVYEQLIPVTLTEWQSGGLSFSVDSNIFGCKISIFKSDVLVNLKAYEGEIIPAKMINIPVICNPINEELGFYYHGELPVIYYAEPSSAYLRIEYCMGEKFEPKKDDYYGYNNY